MQRRSMSRIERTGIAPRHTPAASSGHTDDEVIEAAEAEGFELCSRPVGGTLCVGFVRGDDERFPAFGEERLVRLYG